MTVDSSWGQLKKRLEVSSNTDEAFRCKKVVSAYGVIRKNFLYGNY